MLPVIGQKRLNDSMVKGKPLEFLDPCFISERVKNVIYIQYKVKRYGVKFML